MRPVVQPRALLLIVLMAACSLAKSQGSPSAKDKKDSDASYMVRARWMRFAPENMKNTCIEVYKDGRFHLERINGPAGSGRNEVYEGTLSEPQMNELRSIIGEKSFEDLHSLPNAWALRTGGQSLDAEVQREDQIQRFALVDDGQHSLPSAITPFLKWIGGLKPDSSSRIKNAKLSLCAVADSLRY
ncbi:MAG TPA: hypothetical protein VK738_13315 [Terriglobales bacterium]|jgi:hypothetical protein|nr:hypothetical protein [Terriglobales bacterium]